ncbi:Methyltransferase domain [Pyrinomonas methylaliphatogenes]|uniref:Methyltransferase domain n=2 Tax=Pyrinomonas methylaliphatogenes TaxID=454194 RepID=A0A0B6WX14_9BACT|nr:Methyltransferase domain [Pyrinomonas methylaliphatogenes]
MEEMKSYLKSFDFFEKYVGNPQEGEWYVETHIRRLLKTLDYLPPLTDAAQVLELGAIPYYLTILLKRYYGLQVDTVSFYEVERAQVEQHLVESRKYGEKFVFKNLSLNLERDVLPFDDDTYDLVLCCELLEHLLINPSHMLSEIHRTLKPEGYLLLTTPNVMRRENLLALLFGRNVYDRYHGNGIYGRHNREYTADELRNLLRVNGFEIERLDLCDVYSDSALTRWLCPPAWRDTIFALAQPKGERCTGFPSELYVLMDEYKNVLYPGIVMGVNEMGHLGRGWYERERHDFCYRWTGREAEIFLKPKGPFKRLSIHALCNHPDVQTLPVVIKLLLNDRVVGEKEISWAGWSKITFELEGDETLGEACFKLLISRGWIPKRELGTDDERELGIAIHSVQLE